MTNENIGELSSRLEKYYNSTLDEDIRHLTVYLIREIATKGEPVEASRLAQLMDQPAQKVTHQFEVNGMPSYCPWPMLFLYTNR